MIVCYKCFEASATLMRKFEADGKAGKCPSCRGRRTRVLEASDLAELFEGLTRLYEVAQQGMHYHRTSDEGDEYEFGDTGELLPQLLQEEWPIFADHLSPEQMDNILQEVWPDHSGDLYAKEALWDREPDDEWDSIKSHLKHRRRFFHDPSDYEFTSLPSLLDPFMSRLTTTTHAKRWVRARIQEVPDELWSHRAMGAPPVHRATAGRANPAGISYLYLASDPFTACAEVRAEPGHSVTIAEFDISKKLKLFDVAVLMKGIDPFAHADLRGELQKSSLIRAFADDLSKPVLSEDAPIDYVPTQYLAEFFVSKGFDGIRYRSSVGDGVNLVLFKPKLATVTRTSTVRVEKKVLTLIDPKTRKPVS